MSSERQKHQDNFAEALKYFINDCPESENGIIIWVDHPLIKGKMVFEIEGKLPLEEAYRQKMQTLRDAPS